MIVEVLNAGDGRPSEGERTHRVQWVDAAVNARQAERVGARRSSLCALQVESAAARSAVVKPSDQAMRARGQHKIDGEVPGKRGRAPAVGSDFVRAAADGIPGGYAQERGDHIKRTSR